MRTFSPNTEGEITNTVTRPVYIIELGFTTPLRLSSRGDITYDGDSFANATLKVDLKSKRLQIYNENLAYCAAFVGGLTAGISCKVWQLYGEAPFSAGDADLVFDGELGAASIGEWVAVNLLPHAVLHAPRLYATRPTFNHIPPVGVEFATPYGLYRLEG